MLLKTVGERKANMQRQGTLQAEGMPSLCILRSEQIRRRENDGDYKTERRIFSAQFASPKDRGPLRELPEEARELRK